MTQKSATVAVINQDKRVLLLRRGTTAPWKPGHYCLPGGKLESNEELIECAARELGEETGIFIVDHNYLAPYTINYGNQYSKIVFVIHINDPVVCLNWEHDHYVWTTLNESQNYLLVPGLKTTIQQLGGIIYD